MIEEFSNYVMIALMALGGLAFTVSVITQVIKGTTLLKKIPTDIIVIVISIALTVTTYLLLLIIIVFQRSGMGWLRR